MNKNYSTYISIILLLLISGCASIATGERQILTINVVCKGENHPSYCVASNKRGIWIFNTPQTQFILRDQSPLYVVCESSVGNYGVKKYPGINLSVFGNAVAGGVVGLAVDASGNSFWEYSKKIELESEICKIFN
jgi:hypothetical protein